MLTLKEKGYSVEINTNDPITDWHATIIQLIDILEDSCGDDYFRLFYLLRAMIPDIETLRKTIKNN